MPLHQNRAAPLIMICFQRVSSDPRGRAFKQQTSHLRSTSLIPTAEHRATHSKKSCNIRPPPDTESHLQSSGCRAAPCAFAEPGRVETAASSTYYTSRHRSRRRVHQSPLNKVYRRRARVYGRKNHKVVSNATPPNTDLHVHSFSCGAHSYARLPPESKTSSISCLQTDIVQPMQYRVHL